MNTALMKWISIRKLIIVGLLLVLVSVLFAQEKTLNIELLKDKYNFIFNPTMQEGPLSALQGATVYEWDAEEQRFVKAEALKSGLGYAVKPTTTQLQLKGALLPELKVEQVGYSIFGTLKETATPLSDLVVVDGSTEQPFKNGLNTYYGVVYEFDTEEQRFTKLDIDDKTQLQPGVGYFVKALKPFTLKLKGAAPPPTGEITCNKDADVGRYKCAITEEQYSTPEKLDVGHEKDILQCKKEGTEFKFGPAAKDDAKKIGENGKCVVGYACRTDAAKGKAGCQESSPPPFRDPTDPAGKTIIGPRPPVNLP